MNTELTTFTGNWADFPGTPVINGKELSAKSKEQFDRACAIAKEIRDYGRQLGIDFNNKYIVEKNGQQSDYDYYDNKVCVIYPTTGGREGDMVYFLCNISAQFDYHLPPFGLVGAVMKGVVVGLSHRITKTPITQKTDLKGFSCYIVMKTIGKSGRIHPDNEIEWNLYISTDDKDCQKELKERIDQFHTRFIGRDDYSIRPMTEDEIAQYPKVEENNKAQGVVSHIVPF